MAGHPAICRPVQAVTFRSLEEADQNFSDIAVSYSNDDVEWIGEAKMAATRIKRVKTAVAWLAEGKRRNWKYERAR